MEEELCGVSMFCPVSVHVLSGLCSDGIKETETPVRISNDPAQLLKQPSKERQLWSSISVPTLPAYVKVSCKIVRHTQSDRLSLFLCFIFHFNV